MVLERKVVMRMGGGEGRRVVMVMEGWNCDGDEKRS